MTTETLTLANPVYRGETCRACNAELVFVPTEKGHREPLERATATIDELLDRGLLRAVLRVVVVRNGQPQSLGLSRAAGLGLEIDDAVTPGHVSHFATCPERERFRRGR